MPRPALYVRLLGEPDVESRTGRHAFRSDKRYFLLAFLACHRGDWVDRARLARMFWPEHDPPAARHNLRQLIKRLGSLGWEPDIESGSGPDGARLRWAPATDLDELEAAVAAGKWTEAQALHRGKLLAGLRPDAEAAFEDWLQRRRQTVENSVRNAFMAHCTTLTAAGDHLAAAELYGHLVHADDFDEEALRAYMGAAAAAGQPAKAVAAFERFAAKLGSEFELSPAAATESLARRIRSGEPQHVSPESASVLGGVQRKAIHESEDNAPWLIGRELELSDVHRLLSNPTCRLLTITGPGGVGKSALAQRAAHELAGDFADGCVYVALDEISNSPGLFAAIAAHGAFPQAAGVPREPASIIGKRRLLLVLDDLDDHRSEAEQLPGLLQRCPNLVVITTTRERLDLDGEWLLPLEGLPVPADHAAAAELLEVDAVRLFVASAERLRPDFRLNDEDAPDVARICRLVSGLPLALRLAAAWTRALPAAAIADELAGGLNLLAGGPRGLPARHASMRASIEHSWQRLSRGERRGWTALSVFNSPFDGVTAARVAGVPLPLLVALVDKSLVRASPPGLFSFHPLLRTYAVERLEAVAPSAAKLREEHARYFLRAVEDANDQLGAERRASVDLLAQSLEDIAAAWRWALAAAAGKVETPSPPTNAVLLRWSYALSNICEGRAWFLLAADLFGTAISDLQDGPVSSELQGTLLAQYSWHLYRLGRAAESDDAARRALDLLAAGHTATPAWRTALLARAGVGMQRGRYEDAHALFARALESATDERSRATTARRREIARLNGNLGVAKQLMGDRRGASVQFRRQLNLARRLGDVSGTISALNNLGNVLRQLNRGADAMRSLDECLRLATEEGHETVLPSLNINLGVLHRQQGSYSAARRHLKTAAEQARAQVRQEMMVTAEFQMGRLELQVGAIDAARDRFEAALDLAVNSDRLAAVLDALAGLAWVSWHTNSVLTATDLAHTVQRHQSTSPGTKRWVAELLTLAPGSTGEAEAVTAATPLGDGVARALAKVAVGPD